MKRLRHPLFGWLLVSACAAASAAALSVEELIAEQEQNDAVNELANSESGDGEAVHPTQRGELAAHAPAQQRSPLGLRGAQKQTDAVRAARVAASDDTGQIGSSPLEYENQQLHKMLAFTKSYERSLESQLNKAPSLEHEVDAEVKQRQKLETQLYNATRSVAQYKRDLDQAKQHLGTLENEHSDLSLALQNMTAAKQLLETELVKNSHHRDELEVALGKTNTSLSNSGGTRKAFKKLRQSLKQAEEQAVEEERRSKTEKAATQNALNRFAQLQQELNSTDRKLAGEVAQDYQLNMSSTSLAQQLQAERSALSRGAVRFKRLSTASHTLAKKVEALKRHIADGDLARKHAQGVAREAQHSLANVDAQVKQLKVLVPGLQDKVAADERELKQTASETRAALEARDVAIATLNESKKKIARLEEQYASVVQGLADDQAEGAVKKPEKNNPEHNVGTETIEPEQTALPETIEPDDMHTIAIANAEMTKKDHIFGTGTNLRDPERSLDTETIDPENDGDPETFEADDTTAMHNAEMPKKEGTSTATKAAPEIAAAAAPEIAATDIAVAAATALAAATNAAPVAAAALAAATNDAAPAIAPSPPNEGKIATWTPAEVQQKSMEEEAMLPVSSDGADADA